MDKLILSDLTVDINQFMEQLNASAAVKSTWKGQLTTQTSQTLLGLVSTIGVHATGRILRAREDAYSETAQSDDAIRSIAQMQGLRMTRKAPAQLRDSVVLTAPVETNLAPYTQFSVGGNDYFNREQIVLEAGTPTTVSLFQGKVISIVTTGNGTSLQNFVSEEQDFVVSDTDTQVRINDTYLDVARGGLWNYRDKPAFSDLTTANGRLIVQFGNGIFGGPVPEVNDMVIITYVITEGAAGNARALAGSNVTVNNFRDVEGECTANPSGGSDEKNILVYKNVASGGFGTNLMAVTKSQYVSLVTTYPGIEDAVTQAQREINPMDLNYMNVIRVAALTNSPWSQAQKREYVEYLESVTQYAPRFIWVDPIPIDRDIDVDVFVFNAAEHGQVQANTEQAITNLFAPQVGLLRTNHYESDLDTAIKKANPGKVSYVIVNAPTYPMIVNAPGAADVEYTILSGGGTLSQGLYAYSVAVVTDLDEGAPDYWVHPLVTSQSPSEAIMLRWRSVPNANEYILYGRRSDQGIGTMTRIPANPNSEFMEFIDDGSMVPTGGLPNTIQQAPIRYNRLRSLVVRVFTAERQQRLDGLPERYTR